MPSAYIAGPDVFYSNAKELAEHARTVAKEYGYEALIPIDNEISGGTKAEISKAIYEANVAMINKCDIVVANISPFRGPSADAGTVWEIGYAHGRNKPIYTFTTDRRFYAERAKGHSEMIEDFDNVDNLMIAHAIEYVGDSIEDAFQAATK